MPHTVTLELKVAVCREGMADVTKEFIDNGVDIFLANLPECFNDVIVTRRYTTTRE